MCMMNYNLNRDLNKKVILRIKYSNFLHTFKKKGRNIYIKKSHLNKVPRSIVPLFFWTYMNYRIRRRCYIQHGRS